MISLNVKRMLSTALASLGASVFIVGCASATDDQQAVDGKVAQADVEVETQSLAATVINEAPSVAGLDDEAEDDGEPRPYDVARDARADVEATLFTAKEAGKNAIIVMGANWCHDSRDLAAHFMTPRFETMLSENFEYVYVDMGIRNRNLDIAADFGIDKVEGTPTIIVVDPAREMVLNLDTAKTWRDAASRTDDEIYGAFLALAPNKETKPQ